MLRDKQDYTNVTVYYKMRKGGSDMYCKEKFKEFNSKIKPFDNDENVISIFMEGKKKLTPEVKFLIYNETRKSALSFYYSMFAQNTQLAKENGLRFIFSECKFGRTSIQMLQELCIFKTACYGELPVLVVLDFTLADNTCSAHNFVKGLKRAINDIKRYNTGVKMVFILPSKSPFKVSHDSWLLMNDKGLIRKNPSGEMDIFTCDQSAVDELRDSIIFRTAFNELAGLGTKTLDVDDIPSLPEYISDLSYHFDRYYDVS